MIRIDNPEVVYRVMSKGNNQFSGEEWKNEDEDQTVQRSIGYQYNPIELPWPFDGANATFYRHNENYWAFISILARDPSVFENMSIPFAKELANYRSANNKKLKFYPTTPDLTGHIATMDSKEARISIMDNPSRNSRVILIGRGGAYVRRFGSLRDFRSDIAELEKITNLFSDVCLNPLRRLGKVTFPKDFYLYFAP